MVQELDGVVLLEALPEYSLEAGGIGAVVMAHQGGQGYTVEFLTLKGETVAVATLSHSQIRAIQTNEVAHARQLTSA
jgi:uncharacterized protein DUF4926